MISWTLEQQFWLGVLGTIGLSWVLARVWWRRLGLNDWTVVAILAVGIFMYLFTVVWLIMDRWA